MKVIGVLVAALALLVGMVVLAFAYMHGPALPPIPNSTPTSTSTPNTSQGNGVVSGRITLGPTCPVERTPPDPRCAPASYQTTIRAYSAKEHLLVASVQSDANGNFVMELPAGLYDIGGVGGQTLPRCSAQSVAVVAGQTTPANLSCDTGIR